MPRMTTASSTLPARICRVSLGLTWLLSISILFASTASADERAPEQCGRTEAEADYGPIDVGTVVTLQRHRVVRGDDNWDVQMERFLGRAARVSRLSGVDAQGCAGIRVDIDGGQWFWRIRDVGIGTGLQPLPDAPVGSAEFPQQCHQADGAAQYGAATVGATVVLGRHRPVDGETNWADEMTPYVGRTARVVAPAGVDTSGCPGIRVDIDGQQWFWRVRDLHGAGDASAVVASTDYVPSSGITTDHGRPLTSIIGTGIFGSGGLPGPQECGLTESTVVWSPIAIGVQVVLGRHREVNGDANWDATMDQYVGTSGRVTQLAGVDDQGCPVVRIDLDQGTYVWRVRDMTVTPSATGGVTGWTGLQTIPRDCGMTVANYGSLAIGSRVILGAHSGYTGPDGQGGSVTDDTDWADQMMEFVGRVATIVSFDQLDPAGCPGVRVDIDGGQWFWRIRDMQPAP
jgi:hypothetical protein